MSRWHRNVKSKLDNQPAMLLYPEPPPRVTKRVLGILGWVYAQLRRQYADNALVSQVELAISLLESEL